MAATTRAMTTCGAAKPVSPASITPKVSAAMARAPVTCPGQSMGTRCVLVVAAREISSRATIPTGRLTKKISRQSTMVSSPPSTGPADDASAPPIAQTATARVRRTGSGWAWLSSAIKDGIIAAAAPPCTNRAPTSAVMDAARPHPTDARTNSTVPQTRTRFARIRSVSDPQDSKRAANIRV